MTAHRLAGNAVRLAANAVRLAGNAVRLAANARRLESAGVAAALLVVTAGFVAGCAATEPTRLVVEARDLGGSATRYELDADGTLRWGGGRDAIEGHTTWDGRLSAEEQARVEALLAALAADVPTSDAGRSDVPRWRIVRHDGPALDVRVATLSGDTAELVALLDEAARRRHRRALDALPQAGQRR